MQTIRTTIRINKDLYEQSKLAAFHQGISFQDVINNTLSKGFGTVEDLNGRKQIFDQIRLFQQKAIKAKLKASDVLKESKKDLK